MTDKPMKRALSPNGLRIALRPRMTKESLLLKIAQHCDSVCYALMLMLAVPLLSGCQPLPVRPCPEPTIHIMPASTQQAPKVSYSISAQSNIEAWQKLLIESSQIDKR